MKTSRSRDKQLLTYILKNQVKIQNAVKDMNLSFQQAASNYLVKNELVFDACSMYMAQIGEHAKLLSDETKDAFSKIIDPKVLTTFRNMIDHDYEKVNKNILASYMDLMQSKKTQSEVKQLLLDCQAGNADASEKGSQTVEGTPEKNKGT